MSFFGRKIGKKNNIEVNMSPTSIVTTDKIKVIFDKHINDIKKVMFDSLQNIETRYSDASTYLKCENSLIVLFESEGINYTEANKKIIVDVFKHSDAFNAFGKYLITNLNYYYDNPIDKKWIWSKKNEMLNFIIDYSVKDNHPLSKQYARLLFGRYFYNKYKKTEYTLNEEKMICKSLLATVSPEEFSSWFITENDVVENLVKKAIGRVERIADKYRFDDKIVIEQLFSSNLFRNYCINHDEIINKVKKSNYNRIYESSLGSSNINSLSVGQIKDNDDSIIKHQNINEVKNKYTITWKNGDTILKEEEYEYGITPSYTGEVPTKVSTAQYAYTFAGWNEKIEAVSDSKTYTAKFNEILKKYTITFKNGNIVLQSTEVEYGMIVEYIGIEPTKEPDNTYTYKFVGWDSEISTVSEGKVYNAIFTPIYIEYTVRFLNYDDSELSNKKLHYGDLIEIPQNPSREATAEYNYTFNGWDKKVADKVNGNVVYKAKFNEIKKTPNMVLDKFLESIGKKEKTDFDYTNDFFESCMEDLIKYESFYSNELLDEEDIISETYKNNLVIQSNDDLIEFLKLCLNNDNYSSYFEDGSIINEKSYDFLKKLKEDNVIKDIGIEFLQLNSKTFECNMSVMFGDYKIKIRTNGDCENSSLINASYELILRFLKRM